ncbi:hypothetical protein [uncultured Tateyamaria sp.]|uniref:hypothetical protein n=1 Tax=uncultured Tateyamaria sp. TaxID=455651 RepID=UPI0026220470|nr:hypothetical protein [uncultured Tateyamaria sp.]
MAFGITNTVALITDANRGIGKATTEGLLDADAKNVYAAVRSLGSADGRIEKCGADQSAREPFGERRLCLRPAAWAECKM